MLVIPWSTESNFEQNITLDGYVYVMRACWNYRADAWFFSLSTSDGENLVTNKKINLLTNLLSYSNSENKPKGFLIVVPIDTSDINQPITRDNFDTEVQLLYITENEIL